MATFVIEGWEDYATRLVKLFYFVDSLRTFKRLELIKMYILGFLDVVSTNVHLRTKLKRFLHSDIDTESVRFLASGRGPSESFFLPDLPDLCNDHIISFLPVEDRTCLVLLGSRQYAYCYSSIQFNSILLSRVSWNMVDTCIDKILSVSKFHTGSSYVDTIHSVLECVNTKRLEHMLPEIPSIGRLLFRRYCRSVEPFLFVQLLLFNTTTIHDVQYGIVCKGRKPCSFGSSCQRGHVSIIVVSDSAHGRFIAEFILCKRHLRELRDNDWSLIIG